MHRSNIIANIRGPFRLFLTLLVSIMLVGGSSAAGARAPRNEPTVDLAAMTLRSSDLDAAGLDPYGEIRMLRDGVWSYLPTGVMTVAEAVDLSAVAGASDPRLDQLYVEIAEAGWQGQYRSVLVPVGAEDDDVVSVVISMVGAYDDESSARQAFQLLTDASDIESVTVLDGTAEIGDESTIHQDRINIMREPSDRITLTFRMDSFIGTVEAADSPFGVEVIEELGQMMADRIDTVRERDQPGLSSLALRLDIAASPFIERYDLLDGDVLAQWLETPQERDERMQDYQGRSTIFRLDQSIPLAGRQLNETPRYNVTLGQFETEELASEFLTTRSDALGVGTIRNDVELGDETLTFPNNYDWLDEARSGFRLYIRVGSIVASMAIDGIVSPGLETLNELAALQTACLEAGACPDPAPLPAGLVDLACSAQLLDINDDPLDHRVEGTKPMEGGDAAQTGVQPGPDPAGEPELLWRFESNGEFHDGPIVADGTIFLGSGVGNSDDADGNLYALNAETGARSWCVPTGTSEFPSPAFAHGLVVSVERDPRVHEGNGAAVVARDAATGMEQWRVFVSDDLRDPVIDDSIVVAGGSNGALVGIDLQTGAVLWQFATDATDIRSFQSIAIADSTVYARAYGVYGDEDQPGMDRPDVLFELDAETGDELWRYDGVDQQEYITGGPTVADGMVIIGATDGQLHALDADSGDELWSFAPKTDAWEGASEEDGGIPFNAPAVADGVVYVGTGYPSDDIENDGYLFAVDAETGDELWRYQAEDAVNTRPAIGDGVIYAGDAAGVLHAIDRDAGSTLWTYSTSAAIAGSPAVVDGVIYVSSRDGSFYALVGSDR
jgi:outer membrane protein assembly factor BamB